ncbi:hypothetical protein FOL47_005420 [Perkinsus chesapeaki]|uniref:C2 domain-containing protein n=1 Tax=Perkinsus chesapeaki TaxID=330153 RepID=A0A7J6MYN0_PERCH|nr:hypothetical protein FOL47_005420 [Perkinsus chesapeaki]
MSQTSMTQTYGPGSTITVHVNYARDLYDTELFGAMDPYCLVILGALQYRTETKKSAGQYPKWDQLFSFRYNNESTLRFVVYDKDTMSSDDFVGEATVSLPAIAAKGGDWMGDLQLYRKKNKPAGALNVRVQMSAAGGCKPIVQAQPMVIAEAKPLVTQATLVQPLPMPIVQGQPVIPQQAMMAAPAPMGYAPMPSYQPMMNPYQPMYPQPVGYAPPPPPMYAPPPSQPYYYGPTGWRGGDAFLRRTLSLGDSPRTKAMALKKEGNALFSEGEYDKAAEAYSKACQVVTKDSKMILTLRCNWALCLQKLGDYSGALTVLIDAMRLCDPEDCDTNPKFLYRYAVCLRHVSQERSENSNKGSAEELLMEARDYLRRAIALCPQDKAIREELATVKGLLQPMHTNGSTKEALAKGFLDLYSDKPDWNESRAAEVAESQKQPRPVNPLPDRYGAEYWQERREKWLEGCQVGQRGSVDTVSSDEGTPEKDKDSGWFTWGSRDKDALADVIMEVSEPYTPLPKPFKLSTAVKDDREIELQPRRWTKEEPLPNELPYEVDGGSSPVKKADDSPVQRRTAISPKGLFYMALLALQYGSQPLITTTFTPRSIPSSAIVTITEIVKFFLAIGLMFAEGSASTALRGWTLRGSFVAAALPAISYSLQNICIQIAFQNLDPLVYNLVNQTKLLSTALLTYLFLGKRQSKQQLIALGMLFVAAVMISVGQATEPPEPASERNARLGLICVLTASALSGVGASISELALQTYSRNSFLFSAELAVYSVIAISIGELFKDGHLPAVKEALQSWTMLIPIFTAAMGGIFVGQVTKYAGSVQKGFSIIAGIIFTAFLRSVFLHKPLTTELILSAPLTAVATYMYAKYPYKPQAQGSKE